MSLWRALVVPLIVTFSAIVASEMQSIIVQFATITTLIILGGYFVGVHWYYSWASKDVILGRFRWKYEFCEKDALSGIYDCELFFTILRSLSNFPEEGYVSGVLDRKNGLPRTFPCPRDDWELNSCIQNYSPCHYIALSLPVIKHFYHIHNSYKRFNVIIFDH